MLQSLGNLLGKTTIIGDEKGTLLEVFFSLEDRRMRFLAADIGGWLDVDEIIVSADRLVAPPSGNDGWSLKIGHDELRDAPRWEEGMRLDQVDLSGWPPIMVGPFGGTYSPMLMYEQLADRGRKDSGVALDDQSADRAEGDRLVNRMERASKWIGLPAFGRDGELGKIEDLLFESDSGRIEWAVIASSEGLFTTQRGEVALSSLRHFAAQSTHAVFDVSRADVFPSSG